MPVGDPERKCFLYLRNRPGESWFQLTLPGRTDVEKLHAPMPRSSEQGIPFAIHRLISLDGPCKITLSRESTGLGSSDGAGLSGHIHRSTIHSGVLGAPASRRHPNKGRRDAGAPRRIFIIKNSNPLRLFCLFARLSINEKKQAQAGGMHCIRMGRFRQ
jgi:hypothetical protein